MDTGVTIAISLLPPPLNLKLESEYGDIVFLPSSDSSSSTPLRAETHCTSSSFLSEVRLSHFLCFTIIFLVGCPQNPTLMPQRPKSFPFCSDSSSFYIIHLRDYSCLTSLHGLCYVFSGIMGMSVAYMNTSNIFYSLFFFWFKFK